LLLGDAVGDMALTSELGGDEVGALLAALGAQPGPLSFSDLAETRLCEVGHRDLGRRQAVHDLVELVEIDQR
jgi:hypothetical protein